MLAPSRSSRNLRRSTGPLPAPRHAQARGDAGSRPGRRGDSGLFIVQGVKGRDSCADRSVRSPWRVSSQKRNPTGRPGRGSPDPVPDRGTTTGTTCIARKPVTRVVADDLSGAISDGGTLSDTTKIGSGTHGVFCPRCSRSTRPAIPVCPGSLEVGHSGSWHKLSGMPQVVAFWKLSLPDVP